jgi:hypothetical protein
MAYSEAEIGRSSDGNDGGIEDVIAAQGVSDTLGEDSLAALDGSTEALLGDGFVPGAYEIMPRIRRARGDDGGSYESAQFRRSRHHRIEPDRIVAGMNARPAEPPSELLDIA